MSRLCIAIIGFGAIGKYLYEKISADSARGITITSICSRSAKGIPEHLAVRNPAEIDPAKVDLVVECAHPDITRMHGDRFLRKCSYLPLSLTALGDDGLLDQLSATARDHGTTLYIPHGAAVGLETLAECRDAWREVTVVMRKNPKNLDFADSSHWKNKSFTEETVLYDGPTRDVCREFPRNVNAHAAVAVAGIGFDRTRSILVADPSLDVSVITLDAKGEGIDLHVSRRNPLKGVSGIFTLRSAMGAVLRARQRREPLEIA